MNSIKKSLDEDHYGLEKAKKRIVEHFAVLQNIESRSSLTNDENEQQKNN